MRTSCLSSLALCFAVLATATPGHVLDKRFSLLKGNTVTVNDVVYPPGSFVASVGSWVEGPNNPICDMSCLNPGGTTAASCKKAGCDKGVSFLFLALECGLPNNICSTLTENRVYTANGILEEKANWVGIFADQPQRRVREQRSGYRFLGERFGDLRQGQQYSCRHNSSLITAPPHWWIKGSDQGRGSPRVLPRVKAERGRGQIEDGITYITTKNIQIRSGDISRQNLQLSGSRDILFCYPDTPF